MIILKYINVSLSCSPFLQVEFPRTLWSWDDTASCPAPGQIRGRGINCHPEGVEELSQVSGYYAAMRGSWELLCSVLWMFRPLRSRSFMWDYERNGVNSYRMKEICALVFVCVCFIPRKKQDLCQNILRKILIFVLVVNKSGMFSDLKEKYH